MKVFARERYYTPVDALKPETEKALIDKYTYHFFEDRACSQCEWVGLRRQQGILSECEACAAYKGSAILAKRIRVGKGTYLATPLGDAKGLRQTIKQYQPDDKIVLREKHPIIPIKPVHFTGTLRDYQEKAVEECIQGEKGVLFASPRTGKTVMASAMICRLGVKSLIIASQREWLLGFQETFIGSDTQKPLTDLGKSRIGLCKTYDDFLKYDVCLATVQTFHSENGQKLLKKLRDCFTFVCIDEVHTSSANKYIQEISRFNCKYKIGLTGTPDRKDGKYVLTRAVVGDVIHEVKTERLRPTIRCVRTHFTDGSKSSVWAYIVRKLENDKDRLNLIADWAIKDMQAGHMVLIPFAQVKPILALVKLINEKYGKQVAYPFYGGLKKAVRDQTIQDAREYKAKILVGNIRLLSTGTNIPRASAIFDVTCSANEPMAIQRFSRILTPWKGKPQPIIRYFLDDFEVRRACLRKEYYNVVLKLLRGQLDEQTKAVMDGYLKERFSGYRNSW